MHDNDNGIRIRAQTRTRTRINSQEMKATFHAAVFSQNKGFSLCDLQKSFLLSFFIRVFWFSVCICDNIRMRE
jgi:hypothetical protein